MKEHEPSIKPDEYKGKQKESGQETKGRIHRAQDPSQNAKEPQPIEEIGSGSKTITVIMPVRNEAGFIRNSLSAVLHQDYPADRVEVIVVDGMSTDETRSIVREMQSQYSNIRLVDNPGKIVPTGLNIALSQSRGEIIVRVDGHCIIQPDYIRHCVTYLTQEDVDGVGGPMETIGESPSSQAIALAMSSPFGVGGSAFRTVRDRTMIVDTVAFPAYRRETIQKVGPFDEELVRNQDDEYNYRLRSMGGRILMTPDIRSRYYSRGSYSSLWRQYFQYGYWKVRVMQKHPRQMSLRQFIPPVFVFALGAFALLSPILFAARLLLALTLGAYATANLSASLITASKNHWRYLPQLPLAFVILHVSYGAGFLNGLAKFSHRWKAAENVVPVKNNKFTGKERFKKERTRPLRVLMITSEWPTPEKPHEVPFITQQADFLQKAGIDLQVFSFRGGKQLGRYASAWRQAQKKIASGEFDLVHAQWGQSGLLALPRRIPLVVTFRGDDLEGIIGKNGHGTPQGMVLKNASRLVARAADQVIVVSESLAHALPRQDYHVIPSGIDLQLFCPAQQADARRKLGLDPDCRYVLFAGASGNPRKRLYLAKQAVDQLPAELHVRLLVADRVLHQQMPDYMNASDILLLTSLHEGSPNVVKEALACNLPVISTDVGDVRDRIENIPGCFILEDDHPETIANTIKAVLLRNERIDGRSAVQNLDENQLVQKVIQVYQQAVNHYES